MSLKNRPRIPTPDVTKEVVDREQRMALSASNAANIGAGIVGMQTMIPQPGHYPSDLPAVVQVVLSPIQESEGTPSSRKSGTAALAQAVLSPTLTGAGLMSPVTLPVTVSQLTQLGFVTTTSLSMPRLTLQNVEHQTASQPHATLTEVNSSEEEGSGSSHSGSISGHERSTPLIGERVSPVGCHGNSPTFESYTDRSPILMSPDKLGGYILTTAINPNHDARGRRSTSLPGPPALVPKEDRSMSLPHSPGLYHREIRTTSIASRPDNLNVERLNSAMLEARHRSESFGSDNLKPRQNPPRKISSGGATASALAKATAKAAVATVTGSKRNEVYV